MWRRVGGLVRKEFAQIFRDVPLLIILVWAFTGAVYSSGRGRATDTLEIATAVYDLSRSPASRELISHLQPPYFKLVASLDREVEITRMLDAGEAAIVIVIPPDFHRDLSGRRKATVQVLTDGTIAMPATVSIAYVAAIADRYAATVAERRADARGFDVVRGPAIEERLRVRFNPNMLSAWFAGLLELLNMCTMVALLLTASNLVREKEHGTVEQLLVSPARPLEIMLAKIVPAIILILLLSSVSIFLVLVPGFGLPIQGSLALFYGVTVLYVFAMASMGIAIAVVARTLPQAIMIMILILQPMVFLSGAWNPPEAMIPWMRAASVLSPFRYYIDFSFGLILKGNGLTQLMPDIGGIVVLGSVLFVFSLAWFERSLRTRR